MRSSTTRSRTSPRTARRTTSSSTPSANTPSNGVERLEILSLQQQGLGAIDPTLARIVRRDADVAQAQIVGAAVAGANVPGTRAVRRHAPDIVAVVNQQALAVLGPARVAVGGGRAGGIGVLVEELHAEGRRQVRLPAFGHGSRVQIGR